MLLERDDLLESLHESLEAAGAGSGSMVLVAGEAGAGKTSLVRTFVESLNDSTLVIAGGCDPLTTPRPLSPLYDFAADPDSGLHDLMAPERELMEVFQEVLDRLRNTIRPIVLVIEDIHWADDATLDFLRFIGRRVGDSKAIVVCTYRDDEVGPDHPLRPMLGQLIPLETARRLTVPPLTLEAVRTLTEGRRLDARRLFELTDGNAFYVTEVLASGEQHPKTVQEAVLSRVARLDPPSRRVVEAVSIAPRSLDVNEASQLAGALPGDADRALAAGVITALGRSLQFRHELARSAVEDSLPPGKRLGLHLAMLEMLERSGSRDLARLAHHAIQADDPTKIVEYAPRAGDQAARRGSHKEAASFIEATLRHRDLLDDRVEAELRIRLANELGTIDRHIEANEHLERAYAHFRSVGDRLALASALVPSTSARWAFEDAGRFRARLSEALDILQAKDPSAELARAYLTSAYQYMLARQGHLARADIEKARRIADEVGETELDWTLRMLEGTVSVVAGDTDVGLERLTSVMAEAASAGRTDEEVLALMMLGSGGGEARRYAVSIPALEAGVSHGLDVDQDYLASYSRAWLARVAFEQGRWDESVEYARLVERASTHRRGIAVLTALSVKGRVRVRRGDPGGVELLEEMMDLGRSHELQHVWNAICGNAEHHWLAGDPERAIESLAPAFERAIETDSEWARGEIGFWMWRCGAIDGPPDGAAEPFRLHMEGNWRGSAETWRAIGCPYEVAMSLADGDEAALREAHEILTSLGARPMREIVRQRLSDLGAVSIPRGPTSDTRANPAGLTNRQLEVFELMTKGLSNAEISDKLYISKKTVEHHVSAIFSKLGVDTRARAMAAGADLGI